MLSKKSLKLPSFFFLFAVMIGWFPLASLPNHCSVLLHHLLLVPSSIFFTLVIVFSSTDWFFFILSLFAEVLIVFLQFSPEFGKHLYDRSFELFIWKIAYCHFVFFFWGFNLVLLFGTFSFVSSFFLTFCVCFYLLGRSATFPGLERVALCTGCPVRPSSAVPL